MFLKQAVPVLSFCSGSIKHGQLTVDVLRLDLLHPEISGNKWYKLKHNILEAQSRGINTVLSFGGAWSNHIHALAAAGKHFGFKTIGVIRGERPKQPSAMLQDVERWGMQLVYVSRYDYRKRYEPEYHQELLEQLSLQNNEVWIVPEGGSGELGVKGCEEILESGSIDPADYDQIWLAAGTGATAAGVIRSVNNRSHVKVVPVLKGAAFMEADINQYLDASLTNWSLDLEGHCGGYGKTTPELLQFITETEEESGLPLDQVYTGKMLLAFKKAVEAGQVAEGCRVLLIHTGGLQGRRGLKI
ncbi:1-aminocyclopropane-1-carboxylate deaminase [Endozoicomonas sp. OPT23]|nr:1-aminocyclopropane-1-carboxylate deaminase [Endozoicomonas sp. OPT23]